MRVLVLGLFTRSLARIDRGSQIRAYYLANELEACGHTVYRVARDLTPWSLAESGGAYLLLAALKKADVACVVGVPFRRTPYEILTKLWSSRKPIVLDFNDDPILQYRFIQGADTERIREYQSVERFLVERSKAIAFLTEPMRDYYVRAWDVEHRVTTLLVPNASDPKHFKPSPLPDTPTIGFLGGLGPGRGTELLIKSIRSLRAEGVAVTLRVGYSASLRLPASVVRAGVDASGDAHIDFVPGITYSTAPSFLRSLRICLIPHLRNPYLDFILPVKLFDYMAASRPIVATDNPESAKIMRACGSGLITEAEPSPFAGAVVKLLEDPTLAERMGRSGREAVEKQHNWKVAIKPLADALPALA